jgi:hypothetical protein
MVNHHERLEEKGMRFWLPRFTCLLHRTGPFHCLAPKFTSAEYL